MYTNTINMRSHAVTPAEKTLEEKCRAKLGKKNNSDTQKQIRCSSRTPTAHVKRLERISACKTQRAQRSHIVFMQVALCPRCPWRLPTKVSTAVLALIPLLTTPTLLWRLRRSRYEARNKMPSQAESCLLDLRVWCKHEHEAETPALGGRSRRYAVPLRTKENCITVFHEQPGIVHVQNPRRSQAHQNRPHIVAVVCHLCHTVRIPIHFDRVPCCASVLGAWVWEIKVLHDPIHQRVQGGTLATMPTSNLF
mmetsp:Transcript_46834/g.124384  ORF Transcript_46834/g.124384 Transcript_46834/m.124384 type:complete len:251 (-) Transcript_46834:1124-1876(-)